ncbi:MAG: hypothetical protein U1F35_11535 [Steroidobacteraceae bacterium]
MPEVSLNSSGSLERRLIFLCALFSAVLILVLLPFAIQRYGTDSHNARFFMGVFLIVTWVLAGGLLMRRYQGRITTLMRRWGRKPKTAFVTFSLLLACVEEGIACVATNLSGAFGDPTGSAYITASGNFFDLIFFHSVIVIVPLLIVWSWLLERYDFTVPRFFILFGVQGALSEIAFAGMSPALFPMWLLVYGLMIWLPYQALAPAFDRARVRIKPGFLVHVTSLLLAQAGSFAFTLAFIGVSHGLLRHPLSHFPVS